VAADPGAVVAVAVVAVVVVEGGVAARGLLELQPATIRPAATTRTGGQRRRLHVVRGSDTTRGF
jgi:hypothetical protein